MSQEPKDSTGADSRAARGIGDLKGQVAVITGSTSGIGLALARAVAGGGGGVVLNGLGDPAEIERTRADLEASSGVRVLYHPADMTRGDEIADMIRVGIPDARVEITDLAGDGDHYAARVVSASFAGMSRVAQQRAVYAALGGRMGGVLHALQLTTSVS